MKSFSHFKLKINTNFKAFGNKTSTSTVSETTSSSKYSRLKQRKNKNKNKSNTKKATPTQQPSNMTQAEQKAVTPMSPSVETPMSHEMDSQCESQSQFDRESRSRRYSESASNGYETPICYDRATSICKCAECSPAATVTSTTDRKDAAPPTPNIASTQSVESKTDDAGMKSSAYDLEQILSARGYQIESKIATTLQGVIYKANKQHKADEQPLRGQPVVIKVTEKKWYTKGVAFVNGKEIPIRENIMDEIQILRWLTHHQPPAAMTRYVDHFEDERNIFLIMEDGGMDFFKFVAECHKLINSGALSLREWQSAVRVAFKQMVQFVEWMHSKMAICHLDISLENLLISNVFVMTDKTSGSQRIYLSHNFQLKFCDFGLATAFNGTDFRCAKYVGKTGYKAPKVYGKKQIFDARAADTWSLGVVLFMMSIGAPPFARPCNKECAFALIMAGRMDELLASWQRLQYLTPEMYDLLKRIFQPEEKRITLKQILSHPFMTQ